MLDRFAIPDKLDYVAILEMLDRFAIPEMLDRFAIPDKLDYVAILEMLDRFAIPDKPDRIAIPDKPDCVAIPDKLDRFAIPGFFRSGDRWDSNYRGYSCYSFFYRWLNGCSTLILFLSWIYIRRRLLYPMNIL